MKKPSHGQSTKRTIQNFPRSALRNAYIKYRQLGSKLTTRSKITGGIDRFKSEFPVLNQLDLNGMDPNQLRMVILKNDIDECTPY